MAQRFDDAWKKIAAFAGSPCQIDVSDEELWGLKGGVAQAIVFHWPSTAPQRSEVEVPARSSDTT